MKYILTPEQMRAIDSAAMQELGIPSIVLMENAARSAAEIIEQYLSQKCPAFRGIVYVLCGAGNNGGDGLAIARHLHERHTVAVILVNEKGALTPDNLINLKIVQSLGLECRIVTNIEDCAALELKENAVIIDALLGIGGSEHLRGSIPVILQKVRLTRPSAKIAIDNPTGLNCLTGQSSEYTFEADVTITMAAEKTGLLLNSGSRYCGHRETAFIGAPESLIARYATSARWERDDIYRQLPARNRISSKFDYGRVAVIAGSRTFRGAAALAANAAITAGAGLVELFTPERHASILPEIICHEIDSLRTGYFSPDDAAAIIDAIAKADAVVIGPGLGNRPETMEFVQIIIRAITTKPIVIDADAIYAIREMKFAPNMILTPHIGEFARLIGKDRETIAERTFEEAGDSTRDTGAVLHLKHVPSLTTDGVFTYFTVNGNPGMATAGSGDVLAGIIGAFAARGLAPIAAASLGAFVHAEAGDEYARTYGQETLTASRLIEMLPMVLDGGKR